MFSELLTVFACYRIMRKDNMADQPEYMPMRLYDSELQLQQAIQRQLEAFAPTEGETLYRREVPMGSRVPDFICMTVYSKPEVALLPRNCSYRHASILWTLRQCSRLRRSLPSWERGLKHRLPAPCAAIPPPSPPAAPAPHRRPPGSAIAVRRRGAVLAARHVARYTSAQRRHGSVCRRNRNHWGHAAQRLSAT